MIAVATIAIPCDRCGQAKPHAAFHRSYYPRRDGLYAQPCKDCMNATREAVAAKMADRAAGAVEDPDPHEVVAIAAVLVAYGLDLVEQVLPQHSAVQLLVDALDCFADPDEISQAGRYPPSPSRGDRRPEGG